MISTSFRITVFLASHGTLRPKLPVNPNRFRDETPNDQDLLAVSYFRSFTSTMKPVHMRQGRSATLNWSSENPPSVNIPVLDLDYHRQAWKVDVIFRLQQQSSKRM